jgi:hypothetical protein
MNVNTNHSLINDKQGKTTMKRSFIIAILLFILAVPSLFAGEPKSGTFGLGWYSPTAPVGGRVWVTPQIGLDLGLGFANDKALGTTDSRVHVNVGIPVNVVTTEKVNFFIRPGVEYQTNSRLDEKGATTGTAIVTADLGAEWFVTEQFSLSAGHGLQFFQLSGSGDWGITALRALSFDNVGFHFYFSNN